MLAADAIVELSNAIYNDTKKEKNIEYKIEQRNNLFNGNFISSEYGWGSSTDSDESISQEESFKSQIFLLEKEFDNDQYMYFTFSGYGLPPLDTLKDTVFIERICQINTSQGKKDIENKIKTKTPLNNNIISKFYTDSPSAEEVPVIQQSWGAGVYLCQIGNNENIPFIFVSNSSNLDINARETSYGAFYITQNNIEYKIEHINTNDNFYDQSFGAFTDNRCINTWRLTQIKGPNDISISSEDTDLEGALEVKDNNGDSFFIGGIYGDETSITAKLFIDGREQITNPSQLQSGKCSNITFIVESKIYAPRKNIRTVDNINTDTGGNFLTCSYNNSEVTVYYYLPVGENNVFGLEPQCSLLGYYGSDLIFSRGVNDVIFLRTKKIEFKDGKVNIQNHWKYVGPNGTYRISKNYLTGIGSVVRDSTKIDSLYTNGKYLNNSLSSEENQNSSSSSLTDEITFYTDNFVSKIKTINGKDDFYEGGYLINDNSIEFYLGSDVSEEDKDFYLENGQEFTGEFEIETTMVNGGN